MALILYTNPQSRGRIARWMLEEIGAEYETRVLTYNESMKSAEYLAINPMGKVPALVDDGHVVTEVAAICAYLADVNPMSELTPRSHEEKANYYRWMFFAAGPIESAVTARALKLEPPAERKTMVGYGTYDEAMDALERAVSAGDYICGHRFTAADVYVGAQIIFGLTFKTIEPRPAFEAYAKRLQARPAYQRAAGLDDALL